MEHTFKIEKELKITTENIREDDKDHELTMEKLRGLCTVLRGRRL